MIYILLNNLISYSPS